MKIDPANLVKDDLVNNMPQTLETAERISTNTEIARRLCYVTEDIRFSATVHLCFLSFSAWGLCVHLFPV